jgi:diaminopimelate epimerase
MRIFLPDESEAVMSGSDIRCCVKYAYDAGYVKESCTVETMAGVMRVLMGYRDDDFIAGITMTDPKFDRKDIPATGDGEYKEHIGDFDVYAVNTGVPHAVIPVPSVDAIDVTAVAPLIRRHPTFPNGANVNFVEKTGDNSIKIRTFERGVEDETLSCGTGATASAAVMHKLGLVGETVNVETSGGPLVIFLEAGARMEGPAVTVFSGNIIF